MVEGHVRHARLPGSEVPVYLIDQPGYFDRDGLYGTGTSDYDDNCERFVFFQRAVLETIRALHLRPDVIHCNDWQTGLIPVYLRTLYKNVPGLASAGTLLTIHNLAYLGLFWHWDMALTGLDWHLFNWRQLEFHGRLCFMKAGLVFADLLGTVSPTYAREIQTPRYGSGLDGLLRDRHADLYGIVNGIDTQAWSPLHEPMLAANYDASTAVEGKARCKAWLQEYAGLEPSSRGAVVRPDRPAGSAEGLGPAGRGGRPPAGPGRAARRAGGRARQVPRAAGGPGPPPSRPLHRLPRLQGRPGPPDRGRRRPVPDAQPVRALRAEPALQPGARDHPDRPDHGRPGRHRGRRRSPPLADGTATGFTFTDPTAEALWQTIERALALWPDRDAWVKLMRTGMNADWSWDRSAREYTRLYEEIARRVGSRSARPSVRP